MMPLRVLIWLVLVVGIAMPVGAASFVPASDDQVLERLPFAPGDPVMRELGALRSQLAHEPDDLPLALRVAGIYLELGRVTGDPRYGGYAQAALTPWWNLETPPLQVLVLRATLRQRVHQFDAALADLAVVLDVNPRNAQARLTRAAVLQVQGLYDAAKEECLALQNLTQELVWAACLTSVDGASGKLSESYGQLLAALDRQPRAQPAVRSWALTSLAEMAARAGMAEDAQAHFRKALTLDAADAYLLGAYADFLLDHGQSREVVALLQDKTGADPLLLRYALALQAQQSKELPARLEQLRDRFAAGRLRGDRVHLREEARFTLHLLDDPKTALALARADWAVQKEPADIRILLEAAVAARDAGTLKVVTDWLNNSHLQDVQLSRILSERKHPS